MNKSDQTVEQNKFVALALAASLFFAFAEGYGVDLEYWREWIDQLRSSGYGAFQGNYPPVYIHWLYFCGLLADLGLLDMTNGFFLKYTVIFPAVLAHLIFVRIVHHAATLFKVEGPRYLTIMLLAALNPAIIFDGPVWGQIDMFPCLLAVAALYLAVLKKSPLLIFTLYILSIATKFQMICFAPVFGVIFFNDPRRAMLGCLLGIATAFLVLLPFGLSGSFMSVIQAAYIDTLGQYPANTFNASNLWFLTTGNLKAADLLIININPESVFAPFFTVKSIGIALFAVMAFLIFAKGLMVQAVANSANDGDALRGYYLYYAFLAAVSFFFLLPAMHERYLLPAVVVSILFSIVAPNKIIFSVLVTFCSFINMALTMTFGGDGIWILTSALLGAGFVVLILDFMGYSGQGVVALLSRQRYFGRKYVPEIAFCAISVIILFGHIIVVEKSDVSTALRENEQWLTRLPVQSAQQDWGVLRVNKSVEGKRLTVDETVFQHGFGTHANSTITINLDEKYSRFRFRVGLDDEADMGMVEFLVHADGENIWRSERILNGKISQEISLNINGVSKLTLEVDGLNTIHGDHANWLMPVVMQRGEP